MMVVDSGCYMHGFATCQKVFGERSVSSKWGASKFGVSLVNVVTSLWMCVWMGVDTWFLTIPFLYGALEGGLRPCLIAGS